MTKEEFYRNKTITSIDWWLDDCALPKLVWVRRRVFSDGTADACWEEGGTLYGFDESRFAGYFLSEDEYRRLSSFDSEDECEFGLRLSEIEPPVFVDQEDQAFRYLGVY